jgi:hypothetical protein
VSVAVQVPWWTGLGKFTRTMLMGQVGPGEGPQVQLIGQDPGTIFGPHFHDVAQFQVILVGSGSVGNHWVTPGQVIYVDRHKVYGPVEPDSKGLVYLTLRAEHDPGPLWMPEATQALLDRHPVNRRHLILDLGSCGDLVNCDDGLRVSVGPTGEIGGAGAFLLDGEQLWWLEPGESYRVTRNLVRLQFPA